MGSVRGEFPVQDDFLFFGTGFSEYQGVTVFYVYKAESK